MSKKVKITEAIQIKMRKALGDENLDATKFSVYEARLISTEPLSKPGFLNKGRISASTLSEMAMKLSTDGAIPILTMHNEENLAVGKLFDARPYLMANGETELRGHFAIPNDKTSLISDLDNSVVDEVSIGLLTKEAKCSHCDFDYSANPRETLKNRLTQTCPEGHTVGEDGVHIRLNGVSDWAELSLVNRGAAHKAKIMPQSKQVLSQDTIDRLAASGATPDAFYLTASYKMDENNNSNPLGEKKMDIEKLHADLLKNAGELATANLQLTQSTAKVTALEAQVADLTTKLSASEAGKTTSVKELETKLSAATASLDAAYATLLPHAKAALVASGTPDADIAKDLTALLAQIEAKGLKLHQVFGAGAHAAEGKDDLKASKDADGQRKASFKLSN